MGHGQVQWVRACALKMGNCTFYNDLLLKTCVTTVCVVFYLTVLMYVCSPVLQAGVRFVMQDKFQRKLTVKFNLI